MFSGQFSLGQQLKEAPSEFKKVESNLKDFPIWMRFIGHGFSQASRGLRLYREISNVGDVFSGEEKPKFIKYLSAIKDGAVAFTSTLFNSLGEGGKQYGARITGQLLQEGLEAGNRRAMVARQMRRGQTPVSELRKISDPEVKHLRATLPSNLKDAFDRHLEIPEDQMYELMLQVHQAGESGG